MRVGDLHMNLGRGCNRIRRDFAAQVAVNHAFKNRHRILIQIIIHLRQSLIPLRGPLRIFDLADRLAGIRYRLLRLDHGSVYILKAIIKLLCRELVLIVNQFDKFIYRRLTVSINHCLLLLADHNPRGVGGSAAGGNGQHPGGFGGHSRFININRRNRGGRWMRACRRHQTGRTVSLRPCHMCFA